jgi:hypothetical protein
MGEHFFTTYVRTKTVFKQRLKHLEHYDSVRIYEYELKKLGVDGPTLFYLKTIGEISYDDKGNFKVLHDGPLNPALLDRTKKRLRVSAPLSSLHLWMREVLMGVTLDVPVLKLPVYFKAFLDLRSVQLDAFFTVDAFCGRVHTPIVNLKAEFRPHLRLYGESVVSLDVKQMQPLILGKILSDCIGSNPFSSALDNGDDIYIMIKDGAGLGERDDAKKLFFQLIFGKPMEDISKIFKGDRKWVEWINSYKSREEVMNPHKDSKHTNLAWLLQYSEVQVMSGIWECLRVRNIPFLTIHDELLCQRLNVKTVSSIMAKELGRHFKRFEIVVS